MNPVENAGPVRRRPGRTWLSVLLLLGLAVGVSSCGPTQPTPPATQRRHTDPDTPVGDFKLTERSGKSVAAHDLIGKVWVASFVFTRCTGPCPQVTATMARLQSELASEPDVRLVTFTVDPERDDPAELKHYAEHFHASPDRWLFLTGPEDEIHRLLRKQFMVHVARNPTPKVKGDEFEHSSRLAVVDRRGNIRGYYEGIRDDRSPDAEKDFEAELRDLKAKVADLLREPAEPKH